MHISLEGALVVKNPSVREGDIRDGGSVPHKRHKWVQSLGWEDPLEKGMGTHFSILAWRIPWTEEPGGLWSIGLQRVGHN